MVAVAVRHGRHEDAPLGLEATAWRLSYSIECEAERSGSELRVASPADTAFCRVVRQDFRQEDWRMDPRGRSSAQAREIVALAEKPGQSESTFPLRTASGSAGQLALEQRSGHSVGRRAGRISACRRGDSSRRPPSNRHPGRTSQARHEFGPGDVDAPPSSTTVIATSCAARTMRQRMRRRFSSTAAARRGAAFER